MKEQGQLEKWLQRHRGMGLFILCAAMMCLGSMKMDRTVVETGNRNVAQENLHTAEMGSNEMTIAGFSGFFSNGNVKKVLDIMKMYHENMQVEIRNGEDTDAVKWFLEWRK